MFRVAELRQQLRSIGMQPFSVYAEDGPKLHGGLHRLWVVGAGVRGESGLLEILLLINVDALQCQELGLFEHVLPELKIPLRHGVEELFEQVRADLLAQGYLEENPDGTLSAVSRSEEIDPPIIYGIYGD